MADDLENKSEKKKEIKQDEKIAKTSSSNNPKLLQLHQVKLTN